MQTAASHRPALAQASIAVPTATLLAGNSLHIASSQKHAQSASPVFAAASIILPKVFSFIRVLASLMRQYHKVACRRSPRLAQAFKMELNSTVFSPIAGQPLRMLAVGLLRAQDVTGLCLGVQAL
eukprot:CAMPEP_0179178536 /NCGR_PEP_ID=MMETSP0796-20121207/88323_1 /TAXON_ID=73915 /ORGANISM="Pyrodinium bahamense, Strain pbaha01" /LENGTH=124 /DNA_ID=CAMNT_0020882135 /DNA_START=426 /DNA_END=799 /DNA_ORIENTATION=+